METGAFNKVGKQRFNESISSALLETIPVGSSVLDIGARVGMYVQFLRDNSYKADGIDGIKNIDKKTNGLVKHHDLTEEVPLSWHRHWEWALFLEVGEHIPKEFEFQVFDNVSVLAKEGLVVSWAGIGQRGSGHVNCHTPIYVSSEFSRRGWFVDEEATLVVKSFLPKRRSSRDRIMVLRNGQSK